MKKYLISYGNERFNRQKSFFLETARKSFFFDHIRMFEPEDINDDYKNKLGEAITAITGGGYWLWKPYIIRETFDMMKEEDILIYCDCGCMINSAGGKRFSEYIQILFESEAATIDFELPFAESQFTKNEVFSHFHSSAEIKNSNQLIATVLIFRKCKHTQTIIREWYESALSAPELFTNDLDTDNQNWDFISHRNDQSVFSVLRKKYLVNPIPDETYFLDFIRQGQAFPFWATRMR